MHAASWIGLLKRKKCFGKTFIFLSCIHCKSLTILIYNCDINKLEYKAIFLCLYFNNNCHVLRNANGITPSEQSYLGITVLCDTLFDSWGFLSY